MFQNFFNFCFKIFLMMFSNFWAIPGTKSSKWLKWPKLPKKGQKKSRIDQIVALCDGPEMEKAVDFFPIKCILRKTTNCCNKNYRTSPARPFPYSHFFVALCLFFCDWLLAPSCAGLEFSSSHLLLLMNSDKFR